MARRKWHGPAPVNAWRLQKKPKVGTWTKSTRRVLLRGGPLEGGVVRWSGGMSESLPIKSGKMTVGVYRVSAEITLMKGVEVVATWHRIR